MCRHSWWPEEGFRLKLRLVTLVNAWRGSWCLKCHPYSWAASTVSHWAGLSSAWHSLTFAPCCFVFWLCVAQAGLELTPAQPAQCFRYRSVSTTLSSLCTFSEINWLPSCGPISGSLFCLSVSQPSCCYALCKASLISYTLLSLQESSSGSSFLAFCRN